jgi:1,4-alpha-glucan branching enzyme
MVNGWGGRGTKRSSTRLISERETHWLEQDERRRPRFYTAQWNDDLHHCWHFLLTGETEGYYYADDPFKHLARSLAEGFAYQGEVSAYRASRYHTDFTKRHPIRSDI